MALLIPALAAHLGVAPVMANGEGPISGTEWQVIAVGELELEPADGVTMVFDAGGIAGRSGCNQYTGPATIGARSLDLGAVVSTRMACPGRPDVVEREFLAALERVRGWRISADGTLELTAGDETLIHAAAP